MATLDSNRKLHVYGCSFSDGGGLDANEYLTAAIEKNLIPNKWVDKVQHHLFNTDDYYFVEFKDYYRYSSIIGRSLNIDVFNYSLTANNNEHILNTVYEKLLEFPNDIHIIQWSLHERKLYWLEEDRKFFRLQGIVPNRDEFTKAFIFNLEDRDLAEDYSDSKYDDLSDHFLNFLVNYQNLQYEDYKLNQTSKLLNSLAQLGSTPLYYLPWNASTEVLSNTILIDGEKDLSRWSKDTNNQIIDETEGEYDDCHLSLKANYIVAEKIIERFKVDGLLTEE